MIKRDYLIAALKTDIVRYKEWGICLFSKFRATPSKLVGDYNYRLKRSEDGGYATIIDGNLVAIEDADKTMPLFGLRDEFILPSGTLANQPQEINTTVGLIIINAMLLAYPMKNKIPYINKYFWIKDIEKIIEKRLTDDVEGDEVESDDKIYVREYLFFSKMASQLGGLASIAVPGDSPKSVTGHPEGPRIKAELLEKYKDRLNDPVVASKIEEILVALDKEWVDDWAKNVYLGDKVWKNARKCMFYMQGYEAPFTDEQKGVLITRSLDEGLDYDNMPSIINSLYSGSYARSTEVQLGGATAKDAMRIFQNSTVAEDDCGTELGINIRVSETNWWSLENMYMVQDKKPVLITSDMKSSLIGKTIIKRSPARCNTTAPNYCKICVGDGLAKNPTGISVEISSVGTTYMNSSLKKMHVGSTSSSRYLIDDAIH